MILYSYVLFLLSSAHTHTTGQCMCAVWPCRFRISVAAADAVDAAANIGRRRRRMGGTARRGCS